MAEIIECPQCRRKLRMDESVLGQTVQCPSCQDTFIAALPTQPAPTPRPRPIDDDPPVYRPLDPPRRPRFEAPPRDPVYGDEDEDYPRPPRNRFGSHLRAHRGAAVLTLGILALLLFWTLPGFILALVATGMGSSDLAAMNRGEMMEEGRGQTKAGLTCAVIALVLEALAVFCCLGNVIMR
jgi:hypothetical protein